MSDLHGLPSRRRFIAERLAEWCDAYGWEADVLELPSREVLVNVEMLGAYVRVYVDTDGRLLDDQDWRHPELQLRGFRWDAEPSDTGTVHGPARPTFCGEPLAPGFGLAWDDEAATFYPAFVGHLVAGTTRRV